MRKHQSSKKTTKMARKSTQKNKQKELTLWNWTKKIGITIILITLSIICIYDQNPLFSAIFAFIAGIKTPAYLKFSKKIIKETFTKHYNRKWEKDYQTYKQK